MNGRPTFHHFFTLGPTLRKSPQPVKPGKNFSNYYKYLASQAKAAPENKILRIERVARTHAACGQQRQRRPRRRWAQKINDGRRWKGKRADRPDSVHRLPGVATIRLGSALLRCSCRQPARSGGPPCATGESLACLFGVASGGVWPAADVAAGAVSSCLAFSTLPSDAAVCCGSVLGGMFSVPLSVAAHLGARRAWPLASTLPCEVRTFLQVSQEAMSRLLETPGDRLARFRRHCTTPPVGACLQDRRARLRLADPARALADRHACSLATRFPGMPDGPRPIAPGPTGPHATGSRRPAMAAANRRHAVGRRGRVAAGCRNRVAAAGVCSTGA